MLSASPVHPLDSIVPHLDSLSSSQTRAVLRTHFSDVSSVKTL